MRLLLARHKSILRPAFVTIGFLLIPLCGALYIDDWNWGWRGFVVVVGLVGAAIARLRPRGMALALAGMTIAQILVPVIGLVFWKTGVAPEAVVPVIRLNAVFIVLFAISALLFRRAARMDAMPPTT